MHMQQIRAIAGGKGVTGSHRNKRDLVRAIQRMEGNFDCFATDPAGLCDRTDCLWREDCPPTARRNAGGKQK
jgi:hypothetical protein